MPLALYIYTPRISHLTHYTQRIQGREREMSVPAFRLLCFVMVLFGGCIAVKAVGGDGQRTSVPALFIFGDSLVDVGNNNQLKLALDKANFPHNGIDYAGQKATGRFSNGMNSADFLGTLYLHLILVEVSGACSTNEKVVLDF